MADSRASSVSATSRGSAQRNEPPRSSRTPPGPSHSRRSPEEPPHADRAEPLPPSETSSLLHRVGHGDRSESSEHGTFFPPPHSLASTGTDLVSPTEDEGDDGGASSSIKRPSWRARLGRRVKSKKVRNSRHLARAAGIEYTGTMYLSYYVPCLNWLRQYKPSYLIGDLVSALSVASIYLPMVLSFADSLAHVPPINGLYSFVFNPIIYAIFGSSPALMVGPDATASLLVGTIVRRSVDVVGGDVDPILQAQICGVVAGMTGAALLVAGLARLGFLEGVFSKPFLRGFISAVGFVIFVEQLVPEMGLVEEAKRVGVSHGSSVEKLAFLARNLDKVHTLTAIVAGTCFVILMSLRYIKNHLQPRYPSVAFIPERFFVVVVATVLCSKLGWDKQGVAVLGSVEAASGHLFTFRFPFQPAHMKHIRDAMSTSFLLALLGFFESTIAAKSLGASTSFPGMQFSANRELVALGVANVVGGCFMSLPAFGGYGKSKVKVATGGKSPMSNVFLSLIALLTIIYVLPYMYFLPKPALSSMISVVAISLIEEAPGDVLFFLRVRGWTELCLMATIFLSTIFYSLPFGIAIGMGLSVLQVVQHSTRPRIQILGRTPGTHRFENAETSPDGVEFIDGCLIVKIPEPLTFANTGELKTRLRRLELYGTSLAHPALPRLRRPESNKNVIFDIRGVTSMDGSGAQVLEDIVRSYREKNVRVFVSRGPRDPRHPVRKVIVRSGIMELIGGEAHYVADVHEALKMAEAEEGGGEGVVTAERVRVGDEASPLLH